VSDKVSMFLTLIKERRLECEMSLQDVATIVNYSKPQIWDLEQKHSMPGLEVSLKLSVLFDIDMNKL
jgi:predicted transcriptional regulator